MNLKSAKHPWSFFATKEAYSTILDKSFSAPTAEGRILDHGFTKKEITYIYMLPFKILKEPKLIMFQVKIIHNILPTQSSLFRARITDTDVCPLCNLESQSLKHMLITCSVSSSFWTCFSNNNNNKNLPIYIARIYMCWSIALYNHMFKRKRKYITVRIK